ncbi:MAG: hypothetical protein ACI4SU_00140 [Anaerovoracaceae bacterium]
MEKPMQKGKLCIKNQPADGFCEEKVDFSAKINRMGKNGSTRKKKTLREVALRARYISDAKSKSAIATMAPKEGIRV